MTTSFSELVQVNNAVALAAMAAVLSIFYYKAKYSAYKENKISGPLPIPILGNLLDMIFKDRPKLEQTWRDKYGKVYLTYMGWSPRLTIADPELMREILIKNFDTFSGRNVIAREKQAVNSLFFLTGDRWKKVRSIMTPTFSTGKIKRMYKLLDSVADSLIKLLDEHIESGKDLSKMPGKDKKMVRIDLRELFSIYAMDAISTSCYGIKIDRRGGLTLKEICKRNSFANNLNEVRSFSFVTQLLAMILPFAITKHISARHKHFDYIERFLNMSMEERRKRANEPRAYDDYLSILVNAKFDDKFDINDKSGTIEDHYVGGQSEDALVKEHEAMKQQVKDVSESDKIELNGEELMSNAILLLTVGTETGTNFLSLATYTLAFHQDAQQKLYEELLNAKTEGDRFEYETLAALNYLDAVVSETLRLTPTVLFLDKVATKDYHIEKYNITVKKGSTLHLSLHSMQTDPDYWPEAEKFKPERFLPDQRNKIVPGSYNPFSLGPKTCIGMRFSLTESKLALAKIILNFKVTPADGTSYPPAPGYSSFLSSYRNLFVNMERRA